MKVKFLVPYLGPYILTFIINKNGNLFSSEFLSLVYFMFWTSEVHLRFILFYSINFSELNTDILQNLEISNKNSQTVANVWIVRSALSSNIENCYRQKSFDKKIFWIFFPQILMFTIRSKNLHLTVF